jgi:hypothetical protein
MPASAKRGTTTYDYSSLKSQNVVNEVSAHSDAGDREMRSIQPGIAVQHALPDASIR